MKKLIMIITLLTVTTSAFARMQTKTFSATVNNSKSYYATKADALTAAFELEDQVIANNTKLKAIKRALLFCERGPRKIKMKPGHVVASDFYVGQNQLWVAKVIFTAKCFESDSDND